VGRRSTASILSHLQARLGSSATPKKEGCRMIKLFTLVLIALAVVAACGSEARRQSQSSKAARSQGATIVRVVDGDTLRVEINGQEKVVRLVGIDTPETHKPGVKVECGGRDASASMARLAPAGAAAKITPDPTQDSADRYGRLLAYVVVDHHTIQREQVRLGWAEVYVYEGKPFQRVDSFRRAERAAKRAHRGVWGQCKGDFHSEQPEN
jgi:micrococcal nuclease